MRGWAVEYLADPRTAVVIVALVMLAAVAARPVAILTGWPVWTTAAMLQAGALVGILTLAPAPGYAVMGPDGSAIVDCVQGLRDPYAWWHGLVATGDRGERVGNVLMFVPLGFFAVLATRRPLWVALLGVLAPGAIELAQVLIGGHRECAANDWLNNATGVLLGVVGGMVFLRWRAGFSSARTVADGHSHT